MRLNLEREKVTTDPLFKLIEDENADVTFLQELYVCEGCVVELWGIDETSEGSNLKTPITRLKLVKIVLHLKTTVL